MTNQTPASAEALQVMDFMRTNYLLVKITTGALRMSMPDDEGRRIIAEAHNASPDSWRATKYLLTAPYDTEYKEVKKVQQKLRDHATRHTQAYEHGANGSATGWRLLRVADSLEVEWLRGLKQLDDELAKAREAFAAALPARIAEIQADGKLGDAFDPSLFPTPDDIRNSFTYKLHGPDPLPGGDYRSIPASPGMIQWLIDRQAKQREAERAATEQDMALASLTKLRNMAENFTKLVEFHEGVKSSGRTAEAGRERRSHVKAPPIHATNLDNLRHEAKQLRLYAVPGTVKGDKLRALADTIMRDLAPPERTIEDVKQNIHLARALSAKATQIADAVMEDIVEDIGY